MSKANTERVTDDKLQQYCNYPSVVVWKLAHDLRDARARVRELEETKYTALREVVLEALETMPQGWAMRILRVALTEDTDND